MVGDYLSICRDRGVELPGGATILDFGCGPGNTVLELRKAGFRAFGVDQEPYFEALRERCRGEAWFAAEDQEVFRLALADPYRIPFPDRTFDLVLSEQVLEHVLDLDSVLSEVARVLRPGGASFHSFPPPLRVVEAHTFVPFAGIVRSRAWLLLWAWLGIRNSYQRGLAAREIASRNLRFLAEHTRYPSRTKVAGEFRRHFEHVDFVEDRVLLVSSGRLKRIGPLVKVAPGLSRWILSTFHQRKVFCRNPRRGLAAGVGAAG